KAIPPKYASGSSAVSSGGFAGKSFDKLDPKRQSVIDWYATMSIGGDGTWRTGLSRTKDGAALIKAVDEYVPQMGKELGISPADAGTNKAKRIAMQAGLTQNTKDLAMLKPYVNMLDQNTDILKGLAKKVIATDSPLANKSINYLRNNVAGNPDVAEYLAQVEIVKNEATRVISNPRLVGQMTDTARQEMESIINGNMSVAATNQVLDRLKNDGQRRLTTMQDQNDALTGSIKGMMTGSEGEAKPKGGATP